MYFDTQKDFDQMLRLKKKPVHRAFFNEMVMKWLARSDHLGVIKTPFTLDSTLID